MCEFFEVIDNFECVIVVVVEDFDFKVGVEMMLC